MSYRQHAARVLNLEAKAISGLVDKLNEQFEYIVSSILNSNGRVVVCGMGKSGLIGKKIMATFASTGTPSFFMHPGEAFHGDLGMITPDDVMLSISNSGETDEVLKLLPFLKDNGNTIISMTGNPQSTLAGASDFHIDVSVEVEACPLQLAPTASTTAALAMGDALAVSLMEAREFKPENFARFHPGGSLGRKLLLSVADEMVTDNLPVVSPDCEAKELLSKMTQVGIGIAVVVNKEQEVIGIVTDGDLRRIIDQAHNDFFKLKAKEFMTQHPVSVGVKTRMSDALALMERRKVHSLLVCEDSKLLGIVKK